MRSRFFANHPGAATVETPRSCVSRASHVTTPEDLIIRQSSACKSRFFKKGKLDEEADGGFTENAENPVCAICFEQLLARTLARLDSCSHWFCFDCIAQWAKQSNACPLCKRKITKVTKQNDKKELAVKSPVLDGDEHGDDDEEDVEYDQRYYSSGEETDLSGFLVPDYVIEEDDSDDEDAVENTNFNQGRSSVSRRFRTRRLVLSSSSDED